MDCYRCQSTNTSILTEDNIVCNNCGESLCVVYWFCSDCNHVFRVQNGEYVDTFSLTDEIIVDACSDLCNNVVDSEDTPGSMRDLLHECVRCGSPSVCQIDNEFKCADCGFSWEILKHV